MKLRIWARAAKRDAWDTIGKNPEQQVQETIFFKLMDLAHFMGMLSIDKCNSNVGKDTFYFVHRIGGKVDEFLPPVDALLMESELGKLAASSNFEFLIKFVYEYAYRNY